MSGFTTIAVTEEDGVHWLTLNRPDALNAMNQTMIEELNRYFLDRVRDRDVRIIVLQGAAGHLSAGADVNAGLGAGGITGLTDGDWMLRDVIRGMRACPQPIVALLAGAVVGGGMAMALASDIRIAATSMKMSAGFIRLGLSGAELGVSWHLQRAVGSSVARELMMAGRTVGAERAERLGLVSEVWPEAELEAAGRAMVADLLKASPEALRLTKRTVDAVLSVGSLDTAMEIEERAQMRCLLRPEFTAAVEAFAARRGRG